MRKVDSDLPALATWVEQGSGKFLIGGNSLTLTDVAACSCLGWLSLRWPDHAWKTDHPQLERYWSSLEQRDSFAKTRPAPQALGFGDALQYGNMRLASWTREILLNVAEVGLYADTLA